MSEFKFTTKNTEIVNETPKVYKARIQDNQFEGIKIVSIVFLLKDTKHEAQFKNWAKEKDYTLTFDQKEVKINKKEEGFTLNASMVGSREEKIPRVRVNENNSTMIIECEPDFTFSLKEEAQDNDTPINFEEQETPDDKDKDKNYNPQDDIDKTERERQAKLAQEKQKLNGLIQKGKGQEDINQLTATLDEIEKESATSAYQELKSEIEILRSKLNSKLTLDQVKTREIKQLNDLLSQEKVKKEDLPAEIQTELNNLNNLTDLTQISNSKNKVSEAIHKKAAEKTVQNLLNKISSLSSGTSSAEIAKVKKEFEENLKDSNHYIQEYWKNHSTKKTSALNKLNSLQQKNQPGSPSKSGLTSGQKAAIGIGIGVAGIGIVAIIVAVVRSQRRRKIKEE
ncbi:MAG: hypothetical protein I3273_02000 [Candidatus Moeniiplasma glomeromycotorum]|nr:hypothetical protein [Candidatus Moeniiplasma glomeromycotorum]MCE8167108.1 hypothetical protein [Candidatus Moeniiplasma glomeromycotorum]MCE8168880.1 hypothetical protein [Candidatus Moeniiplasma glomeromycotorum]